METHDIEAFRVELHQRAEIALSSLKDVERTRVEAALFRLTRGPNPPGVPQVYRLHRPDGDRYVLRATDQLRVIFRLQADRTIFVEDIIDHDLAKEFFRPAV